MGYKKILKNLILRSHSAKRIGQLLLIFVTSGLSGCASYSPNPQWDETLTDQALEKFTYEAPNGMKMPYRLYVPKGYKKGDRYPLLVFLHGRGERGTDNTAKMFSGIGLFKGNHSIVSPKGQLEFPSIVLIPQCSDKTNDEEWANWDGNSPEEPFVGLGMDGSYTPSAKPSDSGAAALSLVDHIIETHPVNDKRVYITGISMGGFGTWEFMMRRPELFAAAAPMAGYSKHSDAQKIAHIPIWIFHGATDQWNPVEGSRISYRLLKEAGAEVRYTEYPDTDHMESFHKAWAEFELLPWIFSQSK